ncbi:MAG: DUF922 domain-containing protein, partial [Chloroflexota bacterium]
LLIVLLFGGPAPAAAQDRPAPASVSAICAFAVSGAAVQVANAVSTATERPAGDASPVPVDLEQLIASLPEDRLDAAIRSCASLSDWLGANEFYPDAMGPADAVGFVLQRCLEPTAGLEASAPCRSVVAALATPAPQVQPGASEPVAEPSEPQEPYLGSRLRNRPKVKISKDLKATIPGATKVRYFNVKAATAAELLAQGRSRSRRLCGTRAGISCVDLSWSANADKVFDRETGKCSMKKVRATLQAVVYLPRWADRAGADRALVRWWRSVLQASAEHEALHIEIQRKHIADFRREARGKPCGAANYFLTQQMSKAIAAQDAFDEAEAQGALPPIPPGLAE